MSSTENDDQKNQTSEEAGTPRPAAQQQKKGDSAGRQRSRSGSLRSARTPRSSQAPSRGSIIPSPQPMQPLTPRRIRANKLYRCPPTPPPRISMEMERGFVLDCNAVSNISADYSRANPKLGPVIPPYNSQRDRHVDAYFKFIGVGRTLKKTGQDDTGESLGGHIVDRFHEAGQGWYYLSRRNNFGAGHSNELVDGHAQFMHGIKPLIGYNGKYGYRRNNPWLRQMPSPFGTASTSPTN